MREKERARLYLYVSKELRAWDLLFAFVFVLAPLIIASSDPLYAQHLGCDPVPATSLDYSPGRHQ